MRRKAMAALFVCAFGLALASPALADGNNPSNGGSAQTGYEGQPGNQSNGGGSPAPGLLGYEGQPGNQGG
jgi:hypothetical protein